MLVASLGTFKAPSHFFLTTTFSKRCYSDAHLAAVKPRLRVVQQLVEAAPPRKSSIVHISPSQARELCSDLQISPVTLHFIGMEANTQEYESFTDCKNNIWI